MPSRLKLRHAFLVVGIGVILSFQNCAQAPEESSQDGMSEAEEFESSLPMAYQFKLDTIGYMSCSGIETPVEKRAYFSIRAGAYNNQTGGLSLTAPYRSATQYYTATHRAQALATSDVNRDTRLSLSVRSRANLQSIWSQDQVSVGEEIDSFLPSLDTPYIAGPLAAAPAGAWINYFPGYQSKRLMEASLRYYRFENVAKATRTRLESSAADESAYLVAGYSGSDDELDTVLRKPGGVDNSRAWGVGYQLGFSLPQGYASGERRVLSPASSIQEVDLVTGQVVAANWDCNSSYQFQIVRPEDKAAGKVVCNAIVDRYSDAGQQASLNAIRRVLRVEDWYVDLANRCVMPKRTGDYCYGPLNGRTVQYGLANCLNSGATMCPHFVSVCIRR